ncbi:MAG: alpha/beta fold hydrolase, partial [Alphaproteobacteria bacterium]|nr:alpha/beta fold hydrolase [Alphaproteobacteria bacterium]
MEIAVDGRAVFCATGGRPIGRGDGGDREMLVFLHGAGLDSTVWTLPARYFAHHGYDVLAPDLPGHGRSTGPPLATIAALGEFV